MEEEQREEEEEGGMEGGREGLREGDGRKEVRSSIGCGAARWPQASLQRPAGRQRLEEYYMNSWAKWSAQRPARTAADGQQDPKRPRLLPMGNKEAALPKWPWLQHLPVTPRPPSTPPPPGARPVSGAALLVAKSKLRTPPPARKVAAATRRKPPPAESAQGIPSRPPTRPIAEKPHPWAIRKARFPKQPAPIPKEPPPWRSGEAHLAKQPAQKAMPKRPPPGYKGAAGQRR